MKFKTSAIALAVASIVSAPMIASAEGSFYASARYGFETTSDGLRFSGGNFSSQDQKDVSQFKNFGSRFGAKGETDLGNGMTAYSRFELSMINGSARDFIVGVKGDFGNIYMGRSINHAWDSVMSTDGTWWYGGQMHLNDGVQSDAITYQGGGGGVSFGATVRMADGGEVNNPTEEDINQTELVASFDVGDITFAVGITDAKGDDGSDPEAVTGLLAKGSAGDFYWVVDYQMQDGQPGDGDMTSLQFEGGTGPFIVQYGLQTNDLAGEPEPTALVLSYTKSLGPDTLVYFEYVTIDLDEPGLGDPTTLGIVLKHNLL